MKLASTIGIIISAFALVEALAPTAMGADASSAPAPTASADNNGDTAEKVNVENIKEKYWARGEESELGVVQNRLFSKAGKLDLGIYGGFLTTDPFLNVRNLGLSLAYHFNEYWSFEALAWRPFVSNSSALDFFKQVASGAADVNTNRPRSYVGGEVLGSLLYGKLSLVGKAIIYYDLHVLAGLGNTGTENGNYLTEHIGIGQRFWVNHFTTLRLDYRLMHYQEDILQKVNTNPGAYLNFIGTRQNWTNAITIGVDFLFGFGKQAPEGGGK